MIEGLFETSTASEKSLRHIRKYGRVSDALSSAGQPTQEQFTWIRDAGFTAVVNLLPQDRWDMDEEIIVRDLGMGYVSIPVVWAAPQVDDILRFFEAMDGLRGQRVFVHCAVNMRASAFVYLYRICRLGIDPDDAEIDMHDIWVPDGIWAELIETVLAQYAPQAS